MSVRPSEHQNPTRQRPDAELLARIRRGDELAFEQLVRAHWAGLVAYAQSITSDADVAQDVVQEMLARVWQTRSERRTGVSVRGYLYRAVRNRVIDLQRQRRAWKRWSERFGHELHHAPRTPAEILEKGELPRRLKQAIETLPARRREVFLLAHLHDLTYQEIAVIMDLAPQTVANHMSLALKDLRRRMASKP